MSSRRGPWIVLDEGSSGARIIDCDIPGDIEIHPGVADTVISNCRFLNSGVKCRRSPVSIIRSSFTFREGTAFTFQGNKYKVGIGTGALAVTGDFVAESCHAVSDRVIDGLERPIQLRRGGARRRVSDSGMAFHLKGR
jgi:hypothetical protein